MADAHKTGLAKVLGGWTGTITITVGSDSVQVEPSSMGSGRESAISVLLKAVQTAREDLGGVWEVYPNASGQITVSASVTFNLVATNLTGTRTGFTTHTGVSSVTGSAHASGSYPFAVRFDGIPNTRTGGRIASDGSGSLPQIWQSTTHTITIVDTWANVRGFETTLLPVGSFYTFDIWVSGIGLGRYIVTSAKNSKAVLNMNYWNLDLNIQAAE